VKFAVEQRGVFWLAQAVQLGHNLTYAQDQELMVEIYQWVNENNIKCYANSWQFYFYEEQDLEWFLLKWNS
jgi:hypothetical protein